mmetsp:Transcript_20520/g.72528  ORF Transcript_20520/g.72528 Transcript_20520/m.72528 type:complete len:312 (-) Transcript_20520:164-1099(-)
MTSPIELRAAATSGVTPSASATPAAMYKRPAAAQSSIGDVIAPVHGVRDAMARKGIKPRDHARDNVRALREVQKMNRAARDEAVMTARMTGDGFKLKKFQNVQSKIKMGASTSRVDAPDTVAMSGGAGGGSESKKFLRKGTRPDVTKEPVRPFRRKVENVKPAVPKKDEVAVLAPRSDRDFVHSNAKEVIEAEPARVHEEKEAVKPATYGKVPRYLAERKAMMEESKRREEERKADGCPPGMHLMPESERLDTLRVLQASHEEVQQQIFRLPLVIETAGQVRRKNALEAKLKEISDAIGIFDRPAVYVQDD